MEKVLSIEEGVKIANRLRRKGKSIVLAGGCFDILHVGHIKFLKEASKRGDALLILLESDKSCSKKGKDRPVNSQEDRAEILMSLSSVDYVIKLKESMKDLDYDAIIGKLKPDILATTYDDPNINHKKRQARKTGAKLVSVIRRLDKYSSTKFVNEYGL